MDLQERLHSLQGLGLIKTEKKTKLEKDSSLAEFLNGKIVANSKGEYVLIEKEYRPSYRHGSVVISDLLRAEAGSITLLANTQLSKKIDLSKTAFLDTETTGLAGGSGTYPFLIGIGYFETDRFILKQYFMRDYAEEKALLADLSDLLTAYPYLVTYNGKGYDLPILRTRYILNRIRASLEFEGHLDLLFPARRVWKRRVKDCSLSNLEREILGVEREMNIPSYLIPQAYFDFLRNGKKEKIKLIAEHNAYDIVSMAGLLTHLCQILERPDKWEVLHPEDLLSLGRHFFFCSQYERAGLCWEKSRQKNSSDSSYLDINLWLGRLYKRTRQWEKAEGIWNHMIEENNRFCLEPYLELAKFYEHRARQYQKALKLVERAIDNLNVSPALQTGNGLLESLYYRKSRLLRKLSVAGP